MSDSKANDHFDAGSGDAQSAVSDKKAKAKKKNEVSAGAAANLQREIMNNTKKFARLQVIFALASIILMIVQHEVGWRANTTAGYASYCSRAFDSPDCVPPILNATAPNQCCDPRFQARMFPVVYQRQALNVIRGFITGLTVLLVWYTYKYYNEGLRYSITQNLASKHATVMSSSVRWPFLIEATILSVHVFPNADKLGDDPSAYLFLSMFMLVKVYLFARLFKHYSDLQSANGKFIGALTHVEYSVTFVLKKLVKESPMLLLGSAMLTFILSAAYAMRSIESVMCGFRLNLACDPMTFPDALWLISITILTVGYGEIYPHSHGGRIVSVLAGIVGIFVATATIVMTFEFLKLSRSESKVVSFMRKNQYRKEIDDTAVRAVQCAVRFQLALAKHKIQIATGGPPRSGSKASLLPPAPNGTPVDVRSIVVDPKTYPPFLKSLEQAMYDAILRYRRKKRWVASHDPVGVEDRQITLLESLSVNMEQVRAAVTAVNEQLAAEQGNFGPRPAAPDVVLSSGVAAAPVQLIDSSDARSRLSDGTNAPAALLPVRYDASELEAVVARGPAWMKTFGSAIVAMCATVEAMNGQVGALQHRLNHHIDTSTRRLNTIERRLGIEVLLNAEDGVPASPAAIGGSKRSSVRDVPSSHHSAADGALPSSPGGRMSDDVSRLGRNGPPPITAVEDPSKVKPSPGPGSARRDKPQRPSASSAFRSPIGATKGLNDSDSD